MYVKNTEKWDLKCIECGNGLNGNQRLFCSTKCSSRYRQRIKYQTNEEYRKKQKEYWKNLSVEKKKEYKIRMYKKRKLNNYNHNKLIKFKKDDPIGYKKYLKKIRDAYHKRRKRILDHYENKCAVCGFNKVLDIHHLKENKKKDTSYRNLNEYIVLCPNHHLMYHRGITTKDELLKFVKKVL